MTARCLITTLELPRCCPEMKGHDAEKLARVLVQCPALAHLDLSDNSDFGAGGAERLAGVLGQCRELVHLNLNGNCIGDPGAECFAGVLGQCRVLAHLDLSYNGIKAAGAGRLAGVLPQCRARFATRPGGAVVWSCWLVTCLASLVKKPCEEGDF